MAIWRLALGMAAAAMVSSMSAGALRAEEKREPVRMKISAESQNRVDHRLFGSFLERAGGVVPGPEGAMINGKLDPRVIEKMKAMNIPVIRFPGGYEVDFQNWTDLIDNAPGRTTPGRPLNKHPDSGKTSTTQFGYHEYFALQRELGCETVLVVNFRDAIAKRKPLEEAARNAANMVAYMNAKKGATLPKGMFDWPALREKNGHPEPFKARYVQIGNEWFVFMKKAMDEAKITDVEEQKKWLLTCLKAYIAAIREVDSSAELIIDGFMGIEGFWRVVLVDPEVKKHVTYVTYHVYAPGSATKTSRDGKPVDPAALSTDDWWNAWASMPGRFDNAGQCVGIGHDWTWPKLQGYRISCTEWNWAGWGYQRDGAKPQIDWRVPAGLGAAGFIHGLMREGDGIEMATQSLLVGSGWDFTSIRVDPEGKIPPFYMPTGEVIMLYANHHGNRVLKSELGRVPTFEQPYEMGWGKPKKAVAWLDLLATADDKKIYVHVINRNRTDGYSVEVDLSDLKLRDKPATQWVWTGEVGTGPVTRPAKDAGTLTRSPLKQAGNTLNLQVPARAVMVVEVEK